jgi:UDP-glucose 4-epimerase
VRRRTANLGTQTEEETLRIAVTGGSGFIGGHVVRHLQGAGHEVLNIDQNGGDAEMDICNTSALTDTLRAFKCEFVFHIAGVADARDALADPLKAVHVNVGGTASVLEAARQSQAKRVIFASTCWVANAMDSGVLDETAPFLAQGGGHVYTTTKLASEHLCHDFLKLYGLPFTVLRYGIPYGPGMWSGLVLKSFLDRAFSNEPLTIFGDGSAARRFVHVDDLARAHVLALQDAATNQVYNLEGMRFVTIKELAQLVSKLLGGVEIIYREEPSRVGEVQFLRKELSTNKARVQLGWQPEIDLEEGVRRTVAWYKSEALGNGPAGFEAAS